MSVGITELIDWMKQVAPSGAKLRADSRQIAPGDIFLAFPGGTHDGRHHIRAAISGGASAVCWEATDFDWPHDLDAIPHRAFSGLHDQAAGIAAAWYADPSVALWMIGITGTNGKTSISHWLGEALSQCQCRTALVGTLGNGFPGELVPATHTTPDAVALQGLLADFHSQGAWGVAMEVSSHGLDQGRVAGVHFDVAVLTNLSRDHLDYHGDMANYGAAKAKLFGWPGLKWAVLNVDDEFGQSLYRQLQGSDVRLLGYGFKGGDLYGSELRVSAQGMRMDVATPWGESEIESTLLGEFNAYNLLATLGALLASGVPLAEAVEKLGKLQSVAGRMQRIASGPNMPTVVVDYAHTPDALEKTLLTLKPLARGRLCCVFGAGGGRDKGKRPIMGGIASSLADQVIVTSDNPRNEDPSEIIADILAGMPPGQTALSDRKAAIETAILHADAHDIILIAGKGHEDYQEIHGVRHPFSDAAVAQHALLLWSQQHASA